MAAGKGTPKGKVHDTFKNNAEQLRVDAENVEKATLGTAQRKWQIAPLGQWGGDPLDIPGISEKFDRDEIHQNYAACLSDYTNPGTVADTQALKLQNDWLTMQERAFRARHCTSVRAAIHAAARRSGHAHPQGVIQTGVVKYVEDILKKGS